MPHLNTLSAVYTNAPVKPLNFVKTLQLLKSRIEIEKRKKIGKTGSKKEKSSRRSQATESSSHGHCLKTI